LAARRGRSVLSRHRVQSSKGLIINGLIVNA